MDIDAASCMLHVPLLVHVACYWRPRPKYRYSKCTTLRQGDGGRTPCCCARHQISPPVAAYLLVLEQDRADADAANRSVAAGGAGHGMGGS